MSTTAPTRPLPLTLLLAFLFALVACTGNGVLGGGDDDDATDDDDAAGDDDDDVADDDDDDVVNDDPSLWPDTLGGDRTARVKWPSNYDGGRLPLVVQLHGYTGNGQWAWQWPDLASHIDEVGVILVSGEGTVDGGGDRFWNATDACCNFYGSDVDDVGWLTSVVDEVIEHFPVDTDRIYFTGLSNGGFMTYRMACELSDRLAAVAINAGQDFASDTACVPDEPVSVLHVHGTNDQTVPYDGWDDPSFNVPSARESLTRWAERAGCDMDTITDAGDEDYVLDVSGDETSRESWETGCADGHDAALWTMDGAPHVPDFNEDMGRDMLQWLLTHSR